MHIYKMMIGDLPIVVYRYIYIHNTDSEFVSCEFKVRFLRHCRDKFHGFLRQLFGGIVAIHNPREHGWELQFFVFWVSRDVIPEI